MRSWKCCDNSLVEILSQCIHVSNHHVVYFVYFNRAEREKNLLRQKKKGDLENCSWRREDWQNVDK